MYFFLSHLALADVGYSSSVTPNMLVNFLVEQIPSPTLAVPSSLVPLFSSGQLSASFWLPWHMIASQQSAAHCFIPPKCPHKSVSSYYSGLHRWFFNALLLYYFLLFLLFCGPNQVNHFFCDFAPLVELSCSDVSIPAVVPSFTAGSIIVVTVTVIAVSYVYILITILRMHSTEGRHKAFSTCVHPSQQSLFYGTITFIYVMPKSSYSTDQNKVVSVFYMVVIPMLNPSSTASGTMRLRGSKKRACQKNTLSEVCYFIGFDTIICHIYNNKRGIKCLWFKYTHHISLS